ncbi:hypothetical protein ACIA6C_27845 [Streptomyces sp. NPDC051578]|uniref:hypothetical protein n=1 Tax=Streptomyces sp. NPDC051578 TaxID=3365662 RepID=UPI00379571F0
MSLKDAAAREATLRTLLDVIDGEYKAARAEVQELLDAASAETGTTQIKATLPDGTPVATVSISSGSAEARVTDPEAFTAWVLANASGEIERRFVTEVRPAFTKKLLAELTATGGTEWADPETGVIHEVPGVAIQPARARGHRVLFTKTGRDQVMAAWRAGQLAGVALPELAAEPEPIRCSRCQGDDGPFTGSGPDALCDACARPVP